MGESFKKCHMIGYIPDLNSLFYIQLNSIKTKSTRNNIYNLILQPHMGGSGANVKLITK